MFFITLILVVCITATTGIYRVITDDRMVNSPFGVALDFRHSKPPFLGYPHSSPGCPRPIDGNAWVYFGSPQRCFLTHTTGPCKSSEMLVEIPWEWYGKCVDKNLKSAFFWHRNPGQIGCFCEGVLPYKEEFETNSRVVTNESEIQSPSGVPRDFRYVKPEFRGHPHSSPGCPRPINDQPWIYFGNEQSPRCHLAYTRGPCNSNEILVESPWSWTGKCIDDDLGLSLEYFNHRSSVPRPNCGCFGPGLTDFQQHTCPAGQQHNDVTGVCEYARQQGNGFSMDYEESNKMPPPPRPH